MTGAQHAPPRSHARPSLRTRHLQCQTCHMAAHLPCHRPGGIRQQFKAVLPMVEDIIRGLKGVAELQGPLQASIWDQGDAVGAWIGDKIVAVVFPTPETLPQVPHTCWSQQADCILSRLLLCRCCLNASKLHQSTVAINSVLRYLSMHHTYFDTQASLHVLQWWQPAFVILCTRLATQTACHLESAVHIC